MELWSYRHLMVDCWAPNKKLKKSEKKLSANKRNNHLKCEQFDEILNFESYSIVSLCPSPEIIEKYVSRIQKDLLFEKKYLKIGGNKEVQIMT